MFHVLKKSDDLSVRPRCVARTPEESAAHAAARLLGADSHAVVFLNDLQAVALPTSRWSSVPTAGRRAQSQASGPVKPNRDAMGYDRREDRDEQ